MPFQGYRVVVTEPDGSQKWANIPRAGSNLFTEDHRAAGTAGGQWRVKRIPQTPQDFGEVGYNQVSIKAFGQYGLSKSDLRHDYLP